jgi:diguanylate cyclase (GGDEF)-like protein/PAS domain S-box-containing protein
MHQFAGRVRSLPHGCQYCRDMSLAPVVEVARSALAPRVLVVEDDDDLRFVTRLALETSGWNVAEAATAAAALQAMDIVDPDVVLLDLGLPDADGLSVLFQLKAVERTSWVPVVVLSGRSNPTEVSRLLLTGAQDYLVKPYSTGELHARLVAAQRVALEHRRLAASEQELRLLADHMTDMVVRCGADGIVRYVSPSVATLLGWQPDQVVGRSLAEFCHPDDIPPADALAGRDPGETISVTRRARRSDGSYIWVESVARIVPGPAGGGFEVQSSCRDITRRVAGTAALEASERRWRLAFDSAPVGMAEVDLDGRCLKANAALGGMLGYEPEELIGAQLASICHPAEAGAAADEIQSVASQQTGMFRAERRYVHADGHELWFSVSGVGICELGAVTHILIHYLDISELKRFERQLQDLADHDPLTNLLNRRSFEAELDRHMVQVARYGPSGALLVIDLDHFKSVNDTLGHLAGDELITSVARRLTATVRQSDIVARLGGDEFAVILPRASGAEAEIVADKIVRSLREQVIVLSGNEAQRITASVGIASFDDPDLSGRDVLTAADLAMYHAKRSGRNRFMTAVTTRGPTGEGRHP